MKQMEHPNIVKFLDSWTSRGPVLYIVMEYADGGCLQDYVKKHKSMGDDFLWYVLIQMLDALASIHDKNIIHRDVKPHNIFVTRSGRVKVGDFGVSRVVEGGVDELVQTMIGTLSRFGAVDMCRL